jgi:hypothetical protein
MLDRQDTFDRVLEHLRKQREPAMRGVVGLCAYRDGPRKCAIGALIPDEKYGDLLEGLGAGAPSVLNAIPGAGPEDADFLRALQKIHDRPVQEYSTDFMGGVEDLAKAFAQEHSLEYDPPEELAQ